MRKATPTKSAALAKTAGKTTAKSAARTTATTKARAGASAKKASPVKKGATKTRAAKPSPASRAAKKSARPAAKPSPSKKSAPARRTPPASKSRAASSKPSRTKKVAVATTSRPARPAPAPPRQPTRDEAAALRAFERAHKEFARGRFSEARLLFRSLIEQHSGVAEVTARARTYLAITESRLRSETALPRDAESLYDRGVIELNRGEYVAAQEMFERAIKREPDAADSHYALAATRARLGSIELALQSLSRALELKPVLRVRAQHDLDLSVLRNEPEFERLVFSAPRP